MQPDVWMKHLEVIMLKQIFFQPSKRWIRRVKLVTAELFICQETFVFDAAWLLVELRTFKSFGEVQPIRVLNDFEID